MTSIHRLWTVTWIGQDGLIPYDDHASFLKDQLSHLNERAALVPEIFPWLTVVTLLVALLVFLRIYDKKFPL